MTIEIILKCDALGCDTQCKLDHGYDDYDIEALGWHIDRFNNDHFCPTCWARAQKQIAARESTNEHEGI